MTDVSTTDRTGFAQSHQARFDSRDGFWLTGLVSTGPFSDAHERISSLWTELVRRQEGLASPDEWLSLCHGRETEFTCYLGFVTPERPATIPEGMVSVEVLPHEYAVATVEGTQDDVNAVYVQLPGWAAVNGREWNRSILWIESYPQPYRDGETQLNFEVWLPLV